MLDIPSVRFPPAKLVLSAAQEFNTISWLALAALYVALGCCLLTGCGVRIPAKAKPVVEGVGGKDTRADLSTIHLGTTTREEILRDWGWSDTHVNCDRLFVGQVNASTSKSSEVMLAPIPIPYAGTYRDWSIHFLFVEFNEKGTVSNFSVVPNFAAEMVAWVKRTPQPALDMSQPIELKSSFGLSEPVRAFHSLHSLSFNGSIVLESTGIELLSEDPKSLSVHLTFDQMHNFHGCVPECRFDLSGMPRARSRLSVSLSDPDLLTFFRYLEQVAPATIASKK
jgi:hypothetical protein